MQVIKCKKCKVLVVDEKGVPTKMANESQPDFCKGCACDHSFNDDNVCEYCGEID